MYKREHFWLATIVRQRTEVKYGVFIHPKNHLGSGILFPHPGGIVIGENVSLGENCVIYQHVTIGGKSRIGTTSAQYPVIGDNVTIYAGAKVIGAVKIGDNAIIGANSVVTTDIEANCVYAGVPAKRISKS